MTKVAPVIGFEKTHELLYEKFTELCLEKAHFVRKQCATAFPIMCEVLGNNIFETNMVKKRKFENKDKKIIISFYYSFQYFWNCVMMKSGVSAVPVLRLCRKWPCCVRWNVDEDTLCLPLRNLCLILVNGLLWLL